MKKYSASLLFCLLVSFVSIAQRGPLNGNGVIIKKSFSFKDFDKLRLLDLGGQISVAIGKPFGVDIEIDENLAPLLNVESADGKLLIELQGNKNNRLYLEKNKIVVRISMPEISVLEHRGNSSLRVNGIVGRYFRLSNTGNGNADISGSIDTFDLVKEGNGSVDATKLTAKKADVSAFGNGNVELNASQQLAIKGSGNGNVTQVGKGRLEAGSSLAGNGRIITRN